MKYSPTGVSFHTSDANLQRLYDAAEASLLGNIVQFTPTQKALVEGGGYRNVWIETQPMGGEMYAKRNLEVALNNQIFFLLGQRADGRLPGMVVSGGVNLSGATTQLVFNADSTGAPGAVTAGPAASTTRVFSFMGSRVKGSCCSQQRMSSITRRRLPRLSVRFRI
jgi:hypothetical protein